MFQAQGGVTIALIDLLAARNPLRHRQVEMKSSRLLVAKTR